MSKATEYFIAFFDVLGFENKLETLQLNKMTEKYKQLVDIVNKNNYRHNKLKDKGLHGSFWTAEGIPFISYEIKGAYASDSIIIWANRLSENKVFDNRNVKFINPPVPCDDFLYLCNELICSSIEIGLPLRGSISMGEAFIDEKESIYLGKPFIEVARLEKRQKFIGATPCFSFREQPIVPQFLLPYKSHLKPLKQDEKDLSFGAVLDWVRYWRKTRKTNICDIINAMNTDKQFSIYYENTLKLIEFSKLNDKYYEEKTIEQLVYG